VNSIELTSMQQTISVKAKPINTESYLYQVRHMNLKEVVNTMDKKKLDKVRLPIVIEEEKCNDLSKLDYLDQPIPVKPKRK